MKVFGGFQTLSRLLSLFVYLHIMPAESNLKHFLLQELIICRSGIAGIE